jgi:hypothetical protein
MVRISKDDARRPSASYHLWTAPTNVHLHVPFTADIYSFDNFFANHILTTECIRG